MNDSDLLSKYIESGNEAAFGEIVDKYGGMLYSACLRELSGTITGQGRGIAAASLMRLMLR